MRGYGSSGGGAGASGQGRPGLAHEIRCRPKCKMARKMQTRAPAAASTATELAEALGIAGSTVSRYLRRADWPTGRAPPWSPGEIERIRRWRAGLQEDRAAGEHSGEAPGGGAVRAEGEQRRAPLLEDLAAAYKKVQILLSRERMEHERLKRRLLAGELIEREQIDHTLGGLTDVFLQTFDELERTLPGRLARRTSAQIERDLGPLLDGYRRRVIERGEYELCTLAEARARSACRTHKGRSSVCARTEAAGLDLGRGLP